MDIDGLNGYSLTGLGRHNVLLGKNGSGKSHALKRIEQALLAREDFGVVRYISPERAGVLQYEPNVEQNITANPTWLSDTRRANQANQFRQQSAVQFRRLELLTLRTIEQDQNVRADLGITFATTVDRINELLDRVVVERADPAFRIAKKDGGANQPPNELSSGEAELISLAIECLVFEHEAGEDAPSVLLLDEPDVHLHPDLQARFARFLETLTTKNGNIKILIATHSTAFIGGFLDQSHARVAFMSFGDTELRFSPIDEQYRAILPVFGAHPLSNVFNEAPVLLVEGEDDERIWRQAIRSSQGALSLYPVAVGSIDMLADYEARVANVVSAIYDDAKAFSLRDSDGVHEPLAPVGVVRRYRLACRAAENLLLTDEVFTANGLNWNELRGRIEEWVEANEAHPHHAAMQEFRATGYDRMGADLKEVRLDLVGLMGSAKPWEVIVGQTIASFLRNPGNGEHSIGAYLGPGVCVEVLGLGAGAG